MRIQSGDRVEFEDGHGNKQRGVVIGKSRRSTAEYEVRQGPYIWTVHGCLLRKVEEQNEMRTQTDA